MVWRRKIGRWNVVVSMNRIWDARLPMMRQFGSLEVDDKEGDEKGWRMKVVWRRDLSRGRLDRWTRKRVSVEGIDLRVRRGGDCCWWIERAQFLHEHVLYWEKSLSTECLSSAQIPPWDIEWGRPPMGDREGFTFRDRRLHWSFCSGRAIRTANRTWPEHGRHTLLLLNFSRSKTKAHVSQAVDKGVDGGLPFIR